MKKVFLFLAVSAFTLSLSSCSSDDNGGSSTGGTLKLTVDGTTTTFNNVEVYKTNVDGEVWITAGKTSGSETFGLSLYEGDTGTDAIESFSYSKNNVLYSDTTGQFASNVSQASGGHAKGTFAGTMEGFSAAGDVPNIVVTNGSFDLTY